MATLRNSTWEEEEEKQQVLSDKEGVYVCTVNTYVHTYVCTYVCKKVDYKGHTYIYHMFRKYNTHTVGTFKLSGSSCLPAYPGFIVMNRVQEGSRVISVPSNTNLSSWAITACWMLCTCWAITDSTSSSIRLNSSKQAQAPAWASPLKNFPMAL